MPEPDLPPNFMESDLAKATADLSKARLECFRGMLTFPAFREQATAILVEAYPDDIAAKLLHSFPRLLEKEPEQH